MYFATCPQSFLEIKLSSCSLVQSFGSSLRFAELSRAALSLCDEDSCREIITAKKVLAWHLSQIRVQSRIACLVTYRSRVFLFVATAFHGGFRLHFIPNPTQS